jgi:hypothetical protein
MHKQSHVALEWRKIDVENVPKITFEQGMRQGHAGLAAISLRDGVRARGASARPPAPTRTP